MRYQPGDWIDGDDGVLFIVLAVDGTRALCADINDDFHGGWLDLGGWYRAPLTDVQIDARLRDRAETAAKTDREASRLEDQARGKRRTAADLRAKIEHARTVTRLLKGGAR